MCQRAIIEVSPKLYAAGPGDESGGELTDDQRNELLKKLAAGEYVAVDIDLLAFEQRDNVENRNFIRFRNESIIAMGATGVGKPFLKDHEQYDSMSVAGRILTSKGKKLDSGQYEIRQRARLTAAWAVDLALRNLLFAVSIGFEPTGPTMCSACEADVYRFSSWWPCHWPGDRVTETPQLDGSKKFVRDPKGMLQVKWVYTKADLIETSMCPIGAVKMAGVDGVRAALSAAGFSMPDEPGIDLTAFTAAARSLANDEAGNSTRIEPVPQPALTLTEEPMADLKLTLAVLSAAHFAHYQMLAPADAEAFALQPVAARDAILTAAQNADPVVHTCKDGTVVRKSAGELALKQAKQLDAQAEQLDANKLALHAANELRVTETLRARVTAEIPALAGASEDKLAMLRAVESIADETARANVLAILRGANAAMAELGTAKGVNPGDAPARASTQEAAFDALSVGLAAFCATNKIDDAWTVGLAAFKKTPEGKALANAYTAFTK